jgi:hypothetical protein
LLRALGRDLRLRSGRPNYSPAPTIAYPSNGYGSGYHRRVAYGRVYHLYHRPGGYRGGYHRRLGFAVLPDIRRGMTSMRMLLVAASAVVVRRAPVALWSSHLDTEPCAAATAACAVARI